MDRSETLQIMAVLKAVYPNYYKDGDINAAAGVWTDIFSGDDYNLVSAAVKSYIASDVKGFPPVPGQLRAIMQKLLNPDLMTEVEAWALVKKALRNSAYCSVEEHSKLPELIQKIVSPDQLRDWALADIGDEQVIASNFMRSYRAKAERKKEMDSLPADVRKLVGGFLKEIE